MYIKVYRRVILIVGSSARMPHTEYLLRYSLEHHSVTFWPFIRLVRSISKKQKLSQSRVNSFLSFLFPQF